MAVLLPEPSVDAAVTGTTYINVDHPDYDGDVQAAVDAHTAGTIYIPGRVTARTPGNVTYGPGFSFQGDGREATVWSSTTDGASSTWALQSAGAAGAGDFMNTRIAGIGFRGPSYGDIPVMGTAGATMRGVRLSRRTLLHDCDVRGYGAGAAFSEDHAVIRDCTISDNHYNVAWVAVAGMWGNHTVSDSNCDGATMASFAVEDGTFIDGSFFSNVHMGRAPYGIYAPPGRVETRFIINSSFMNCGAEQFGNGWIKGTATDQVKNVFFDVTGNSYDAAFKISAVAFTAVLECGFLEACNVESFRTFPTGTAPATAYVYTTGASFGTGNTHFSNLLGDVFDACESQGKPFLARPSDGGPILTTFSTSKNQRGLFMKANAAIAKGDLIRLVDPDLGRPWNAAGSVPVGIARNTGAVGTTVPVITAGPTGTLAHADGTGVGALKFVKPSATAGRVAEATDYTDGPIIGVSIGSAAANADLNMHVRLGTWDSA